MHIREQGSIDFRPFSNFWADLISVNRLWRNFRHFSHIRGPISLSGLATNLDHWGRVWSKITRSSLKQIRPKKYLPPLGSCNSYCRWKPDIFDPSRRSATQEVCAKPQNILHSHTCTSCASNYRRKEYNFRNAGNWWYLHGGSKPWSFLNKSGTKFWRSKFSYLVQ